MTLFIHGYSAETAPRMTRRVMRGFSATRFSAARRRSGYSVSDLARLSDLGLSTIHKWESGKVTPQIDCLVRVMGVLGAPIDEVVIVDPDQRYPGDWRVINGLTQPELAASVKIATSTLRGIERADLTLSDVNAEKLATALGISAAEYRRAYHRARIRPAGTPV